MIVGFLEDIMFSVSSRTVQTFNDMSRSGGARIEYHSPINAKPVAEFVGPDTEQRTFTMDLRKHLGVSVTSLINNLRNKRDTGKSCTLIIGGSYHGEWLIESLDESHKQFNRGELTSASISITLKDGV